MEWIEEPAYEYSDWEEEIRAEYAEYKRAHCFCHIDEDCECVPFEEFRQCKQDELESYWDIPIEEPLRIYQT